MRRTGGRALRGLGGAAVAVGAVMLMLAAVGVHQGRSAAAAGPTVVFLGDSIFNISRAELIEGTPDWVGPNTVVLAENNRTIREMHERWLASITPPVASSVVVVGLGTNDAGGGNPAALEDLAALSSDLAASPCVVWITVDEHFMPDSPVPAQLNAAVHWMAGVDPDVHVVDWNAAVHPPEDRMLELTSDGVHPNEAGRQLLADLLWEAVDADCRPE